MKSHIKEEEDMECGICYGALLTKDVYLLDGCDHVNCRNCLSRTLEQAVTLISLNFLPDERKENYHIMS